ncbi:hypothetical protein [Sphingomonas aerolata]|uniref:hypothetical protein n=1 Tax=Sphingomonas aerolata TaxID=185951 RepID=UPI00141AC53E|nr:hypothetical protein [Sphingomonas aerolata]NII57809.1 hypothetical protein [Sphingomonas aerolata]
MSDFDPVRRATLAGASSAFLSRSSVALPPTGPSSTTATVSVLDYIPSALHGSIRQGRCRNDLTRFFQAAVIAANAGRVLGEGPGGVVFVPAGTYPVSSIGIRDTIIRGEHRSSSCIVASTTPRGDAFLLDAMLDRDGQTKNASGNGYAESLSIDAGGLGYSGLRTYGGGCSPRDLTITGAKVGISAGLPMWSTFSNIYCIDCEIGFYTFAVQAGDSGTSATFINCWANRSKRHGFYITQLMYSSLLNCAAQDSGENGFYVEGDANGSSAAYSLQFIGCGNEGRGRPFYFRKCRDLTLIGARIVSPAVNTDFITLDDSSGSIRDVSTVGPPRPPALSVRLVNHGAPPGGVLIDGSILIIDPRSQAAFTVIGGGINDQTGLQAPGLTLASSIGMTDARVEMTEDIPAMTLRAGKTRLAAFPLRGGAILSAPPATDLAKMIERDDVAITLTSDRRGLRFLFKDGDGRTRAIEVIGQLID